MNGIKNFLSRNWVKAVLVIVAFALPQILPLLPEGSKGALILGSVYSILVGLGIITPAPAAGASKVIPGSTILKE